MCQRASTDKRPAFSLVRVEGEGGVLCPALWAMRRTEDDCAKAGDAKNSHRTDHSAIRTHVHVPCRRSLATHAHQAGSKMYKQLCGGYILLNECSATKPSQQSGGVFRRCLCSPITYLLLEFEGQRLTWQPNTTALHNAHTRMNCGCTSNHQSKRVLLFPMRR